MERVTLLPSYMLNDGWIDETYIPQGESKYYIRNRQVGRSEDSWRHLRSDEIEVLVRNNNTATSWDTVLVAESFDPNLVRDSRFYGLVRIGRISAGALRFHDLCLPVGITGSSIHSCDIGDNAAIHNVRYLSHYIIGDSCMLFNILEMSTTDHAKFGNGTIKDGEKESVRVRMEIMNETGGRSVYPFDGMIPADAYIWARYRDDIQLQRSLERITQERVDTRRGYYGTIGERCVIKNSSIIKDVKIGSDCYIKGASKLKNITINSSDAEPSQIGENVILVNGIVGYGCRIFYSSTAVRFVMGSNCVLKYGARLINTLLGDNSTISCCEVLNNLIFPAHEQHHNNSFLVASVILGQSNLAAGATVGSNHNSRTNDNEIVAGRGFWPGLCTSLKHSSKFASYTLLSKAAYPYEMNIPLPFSLVSDNPFADRLEVMPAFWWMYNMYALARNSWKYHNRDRRKVRVQNIEFDTLAPDSVEEIISARGLLERWTGAASCRAAGQDPDQCAARLADMGRMILSQDTPDEADSLEILGEGMERSHRKVIVRKAWKAWRAYGDMIIHYAAMNMLSWLDSHDASSLTDAAMSLSGRCSDWVNLGGQLVKTEDVDRLRADIRDGVLSDWEAIHARYSELWESYPEDKLRHALSCAAWLMGVSSLSAEHLAEILKRERHIQDYIKRSVYSSRSKDYTNSFREATYRNREEMTAVIGNLDDNSFIIQINERTASDLARIDAALAALGYN